MVNQILPGNNSKFDMLKLSKSILSNKRLIAVLGNRIHIERGSQIEYQLLVKVEQNAENQTKQ